MIPTGSTSRKEKKKELGSYGNVNFLYSYIHNINYPLFCINEICYSVALKGERVTKFPSLAKNLPEWFQEDRKWKKKERIFTGSYGNVNFLTYPPFCDNADIFCSVAWEGERVMKFPSFAKNLPEWFQEDRKWGKKKIFTESYRNINELIPLFAQTITLIYIFRLLERVKELRNFLPLPRIFLNDSKRIKNGKKKKELSLDMEM